MEGVIPYRDTPRTREHSCSFIVMPNDSISFQITIFFIPHIYVLL